MFNLKSISLIKIFAETKKYYRKGNSKKSHFKFLVVFFFMFFKIIFLFLHFYFALKNKSKLFSISSCFKEQVPKNNNKIVL